jgi:hypothetical protein
MSNLHCSEKHKLIPMVDIIAGQVKFILDACQGVDCLNYSTRIGHIQTAALNCEIEIGRIITKDVEQTKEN